MFALVVDLNIYVTGSSVIDDLGYGRSAMVFFVSSFRLFVDLVAPIATMGYRQCIKCYISPCGLDDPNIVGGRSKPRQATS